jgi:hypothetical protein
VKQPLLRQRIYAVLAWAVDLHDESGQLHPSLAGKDLIEPLAGQPGLDAVVAVEQDGSEFDGNLLVIKRTLTGPAGQRLEEIPAGTVTPPTGAEVAAVNQALDYLGYTGPRQLRLLLALDCTTAPGRGTASGASSRKFPPRRAKDPAGA